MIIKEAFIHTIQNFYEIEPRHSSSTYIQELNIRLQEIRPGIIAGFMPPVPIDWRDIGSPLNYELNELSTSTYNTGDYPPHTFNNLPVPNTIINLPIYGLHLELGNFFLHFGNITGSGAFPANLVVAPKRITYGKPIFDNISDTPYYLDDYTKGYGLFLKNGNFEIKIPNLVNQEFIVYIKIASNNDLSNATSGINFYPLIIVQDYSTYENPNLDEKYIKYSSIPLFKIKVKAGNTIEINLKNRFESDYVINKINNLSHTLYNFNLQLKNLL